MEVSFNPDLHFGVITILFNHGILDNIRKSLFDYEIPNNYSDLVILFENDNTMVSKDDIKPESNIHFTPIISIYGSHPQSFTINTTSYSALTPLLKEIDGIKQLSLNFSLLFEKFYPDSNKNNVASTFNCIYTHYKKVNNILTKIPIFGIVKQKYGFDSERYLFAYDHTILSKEQTAFIIKNIFFNENN